MKISTIIDLYDDFKEVGNWQEVITNDPELQQLGIYGSVNSDGNPGPVSGKMYSRTVKVARSDGVVALETEWLTDMDIEREKKERAK